MHAAARVAWLLGVALVLTGCNGSQGPQPLPTVGEIYQLVLDSPGTDTDGDCIPDDVELHPKVATDPDQADTDADGVLDSFEIFGDSFLFVVTDGEAGELHEDAPILGSARDPADTGEEHMVDSDGDGVHNYLEYYGYIYDWPTGKFVKWTEADRQAHPEVEWFRTDPLQPSTDQDAYPDGMEVSGLKMDVAVEDPGRHPLVAAYPNIVVTLEGYNVTLNDQVTYSKGGSLAKGQSWSRQTESSHSVSHNYNWEVGIEGGWGSGKDGGISVKGHFNFSYGYQTTNTESTSVSVGSSVNEEINWNRARCYNPTAAARIKLLLKVENHGTAPASNIIPTINLRIGGSNVATFRPANAMIEMLMPRGTYPEGDGIYWVIDATENGPLMLTDWELKALERGAPVNIAVTQLTADVMRLDETGAWQPMGDINEYTARCQAVGASLFADFGDGKFNHYLVYAGDGPAAPAVTLRDALRWTMQGRKQGRETFIRYERDGVSEEVQITNDDLAKAWVVNMDQATRDGLEPGEHPLDVRLNRDSHVELMAPRSSEDQPPTIYCAYAVPVEDGYDIVVCASDYDGIEKVAFVDRYGNELAMEPDGRGPWFFSCRLGGEYEFSLRELERVAVTSVDPDAAVAEQTVDLIHTIVSQPPIITSLVYDQGTRTLKAKVVPGGLLAEDALAEGSIRLYHPSFLAIETKEDRDGYITMIPTIYWFEEPDVYECALPRGWMENMRVVAASAGGLYAVVDVADIRTIHPYAAGTLYLQTRLENIWEDDQYVVGGRYYVPQVDLDYRVGSGQNISFPLSGGVPAGCRRTVVEGTQSSFGSRPWPANGNDLLESGFPAGDIYLRDSGKMTVAGQKTRFGIRWAGNLADVEMSGKAPWPFYLELTSSGVAALAMTFEDAPDFAVAEEDVYVFETGDGRYGKLIVDERPAPYFYKPFFFQNPWIIDSAVTCDYVVFRKPGDGDAPPTVVYTTPDAYYSVGAAIPVNSLVFGDDGDPADTFEISPPLPAGLVFNDHTGDITGTPTQAQSATSYIVTCENTGGQSTTTVTITILDTPAISYASPVTCPTSYFTTQVPTVTGVVEQFSVDPRLPGGLVLDVDTGIISGTPTETTSAKDYMVTATNQAGGSATATINITTPLGAPHDLGYPETSVAYEIDQDIVPLAPTVSGEVDLYTISPALPAGLSIHSRSGVISGKPTAANAATTYVITAENAAGTTTTTIIIETYVP